MSAAQYLPPAASGSSAYSTTNIGSSAGGGMVGAGLALGGANLIGMGIQAGINQAAASKAHDRSKNWATRKYQYELIALNEAGINPAYMFSNEGAAAAGRNNRAQMAAPVSAPNFSGVPQAMLAGAQAENLQAQTQAQQANAQNLAAQASRTRADEDLIRSRQGQVDAQTERMQIDLEILRDNPDLAEKIMIQQGAPKNMIDALQRILGDDTGGLVGAGAQSGLWTAGAMGASSLLSRAYSNWRTKGTVPKQLLLPLARKTGMKLPFLTRLIPYAGALFMGYEALQALSDSTPQRSKPPTKATVSSPSYTNPEHSYGF